MLVQARRLSPINKVLGSPLHPVGAAEATTDPVMVGPATVEARTVTAAPVGAAIPLHHLRVLPLRPMAVAMEAIVAETRVQAVPTPVAEVGV